MSSPTRDDPHIIEMHTAVHTDRVGGYPELAHYMSKYPEAAFFRRFSALGMRQLLYLQYELQLLETKLKRAEAVDARSDDPGRQGHSRDWAQLDNSRSRGDCEQWDVLQKISSKLNEYHETLLRHHHVAMLAHDSKYDLEQLQLYLDKPENGLYGEDRKIYGTINPRQRPAADLAAIKGRGYQDRFSRWLTSTFLEKFDRLVGRHTKETSSDMSEEQDYDEGRLLELAGYFETAVASLLPLTSIVVLYCVHDMPARLSIIAAFSFVFSWTIMYCTNARPVDVFSATAAFCAVQVVFVSNNF